MTPDSHPSFRDHENVTFIHDRASGLRAIIAVHSTALGPAAGGVRMRQYATMDMALDDALRLSRAMSYKNAMAELPLGGGKSVIVGDPATEKTDALLEAFGRAVDRLGGTYYAAEDMGIGPDDMRCMAKSTRYVAGLTEGPAASGDPSPVTARGVFSGICRAIQRRLGRDDLSGVTVAIQGVGHVGFHLSRMLAARGAQLIVCDVNHAAVRQVVAELGATAIEPSVIYDQRADVFAPCAAGGVLTPDTIGRLKVGVVAGAANNQLADDTCGDLLHQRGILYAPDYVINGGGIINVAAEIGGLYDGNWVEQKLARLTERLDTVLADAQRLGMATNRVADSMAEAILQEASKALRRPRH